MTDYSNLLKTAELTSLPTCEICGLPLVGKFDWHGGFEGYRRHTALDCIKELGTAVRRSQDEIVLLKSLLGKET